MSILALFSSDVYETASACVIYNNLQGFRIDFIKLNFRVSTLYWVRMLPPVIDRHDYTTPILHVSRTVAYRRCKNKFTNLYNYIIRLFRNRPENAGQPSENRQNMIRNRRN